MTKLTIKNRYFFVKIISLQRIWFVVNYLYEKIVFRKEDVMAKRQSKIKSLDDYVTENVDVIQNKLLGDYNSKGYYCIEQRITNELIKLPKTIKESYNSDIFCTSKTRNGEVVDFKISITNNVEKNEDIAVLEVLEKVAKQGGKSVQMIKTVIGKYIGEDNANFTQKALKYYNVSRPGVGQEVVEYEDKNINNRKEFLTQLDDLSYEAFNKAYKDYYNRRLKVLKHEHNTFSKDIMDMIKEDYDNPAIAMFLKNKKYKNGMNYKAMNETMDNAVRYYADCPQYKVSKQIFDHKTDKPFDQFRNAMQTIKYKMLHNIYDKMVIDNNPEMRAEFEDYTNSGISNMLQFIVERRAESDGLDRISSLFGQHKDKELDDISENQKIHIKVFPQTKSSPVNIINGKVIFDSKSLTPEEKRETNNNYNLVQDLYLNTIGKGVNQVLEPINKVQSQLGNLANNIINSATNIYSLTVDRENSDTLTTASQGTLHQYNISDEKAQYGEIQSNSLDSNIYNIGITDLSNVTLDATTISITPDNMGALQSASGAVELLTTQRISERGGYSMTRHGA